MDNRGDSFITDIRTVRVDIGNGFEEFKCVYETVGECVSLKVGNPNSIGMYIMLESQLKVVSSLAEYEIKDWYETPTNVLCKLKEESMYGFELNILPMHADDFVKVINAFKNIHKFGKWKLQIKNMPINDKGFKGLIREILRDKVKPQYPNYNERYENKLINVMFKDSIKALGEASADTYELYYLKYIRGLKEFIESNSGEAKPMVEKKPGIGTKIMSIFK